VQLNNKINNEIKYFLIILLYKNKIKNNSLFILIVNIFFVLFVKKIQRIIIFVAK
tara:strand:+ start:2424 stop:2588 length:165 start_codon:yes stop_codon:yes gene_type:complete